MSVSQGSRRRGIRSHRTEGGADREWSGWTGANVRLQSASGMRGENSHRDFPSAQGFALRKFARHF